MKNSSSLEYALLGLLRQKAQSGYDLRKLFATTPLRHFSDSPGSIYPALRRMQGRKWLSASAADGGARKRQLFRVTAAGERALVEWLSRPITRDDVIWRLNDIVLRFAFLDGNVPRKVTATFLWQFECALESYTRELREYAANFSSEMKSTTGAMAFNNGLEGYEAQLAWARRIQKELEKH
jgi:DNA-binding PadR family transcriptional regulator